MRFHCRLASGGKGGLARTGQATLYSGRPRTQQTGPHRQQGRARANGEGHQRQAAASADRRVCTRSSPGLHLPPPHPTPTIPQVFGDDRDAKALPHEDDASARAADVVHGLQPALPAQHLRRSLLRAARARHRGDRHLDAAQSTLSHPLPSSPILSHPLPSSPR